MKDLKLLDYISYYECEFLECVSHLTLAGIINKIKWRPFTAVVPP